MEIECMASVLKKRRKKMRKHKYKKLRRRQKFLRRKS
ncbi:MAG: AURKAIP1/COX24 domain-containing protein [Nitrospira sp. UW-LDO-02]|nr:MAG: AURKAIP1/COX24 domain-containing protein [Nitrospira sp. UW-LDO-02]